MNPQNERRARIAAEAIRKSEEVQRLEGVEDGEYSLAAASLALADIPNLGEDLWPYNETDRQLFVYGKSQRDRLVIAISLLIEQVADYDKAMESNQ